MNRKRDSTLADLKRELAEARAERDEARQRLAERTSERDEALAREAATGEVLQVVSSSSGDLRPVWDAMLEKAIRLCRADQGDVFRLQDGVYRMAGAWGIPEAYREIEANIAIRPGRDTLVGRVATQAEAVQIVDVQADPEYGPKEDAQVGSVQTMLGVPLMRAGVAIGVFGLGRRRVEAFSESEVNLVTGFAQQAVIAMENARLITETREALEQQSATAEVLSVINASPGDVTPAFETMLEKATRLCDAEFGLLQLYDGAGGGFRFVAGYDLPPAVVDYLRQRESTGDPIRPLPGGIFGPLIAGEASIQIADIGEWDRYRSGAAPMHRVFHELGGARTWLTVALRKDGALSGLLSLYRCEVRPFSDRHLVLLRNFAAQAEIAIENARLLTETKEALEQQTATAEVLQVINSSPGDLAPVFDAMLEKAMRLCDATFGMLNTYDGKRFHYGAERGVPAAYEEFRRSNIRAEGHVYGAGTSPARMVDGEDLVHNPDLKAEDAYQRGEPYRRALVDLGGARSHLAVTLRKDGALVGFLAIYRQEVRPFSDKQIALLQNFAAQAVIAMENARLITETREALEQQTATAEVLGVINSSPGDLKPVFDAILEKAHTLLGASYGLLGTYDGEQFRAVATHGLAGPIDALVREPFHPPPGSPHERLVTGEPVVHISDLATEKIWEQDDPKRLATLKMGIRTLLFVPLRKDDLLLGYISADRLEVKPFTGKEIALLQSFAAQAVIAMENARLITETREALDQQTATAEVLGVINSSPGDLAPVFDAMLERAMRLCEATGGLLRTYDGNAFHAAAMRGVPNQFAKLTPTLVHPDPASGLGRIENGEDVVQIGDFTDTGHPRATSETWRALRDLSGIRTALWVALRKNNKLLGAFVLYRHEVRRFSDKQIALVENFAAQAVIAMENARLLGDLRERTEDLQQSLEYQTATSDVLKVISRSTFDLHRVLQTLAESAAALAQSDTVFIFRREGDVVRLVAQHAPTPAYGAVIGSLTLGADHRSTTGRALMTGETVRITDVQKEPGYQLPQSVADKVGSTMAVPLLRDGETIGVITLARLRVEPYNDRQVDLVRTFADQAVIAIENARLLAEIQQRQAELRVTFDNMADGVAMFDQELRLTAWNRNFQELLQLPDALLTERPGFDAYIRYLTERGEFGDSDPESEITRLRARLRDHYSFERTRPDGTVIEVRNNPMPDGGVVVIYSDITERKRSEEEIRAARDAAEAAYRDLKAAQANLVQAQKMAALGQLTAGIAHEIKNPLNFVNNFASLSVELLDELKETTAPALVTLDEDKRADVDDTIELLTGNLDKIVEHGKRADNIVKSMLEHSRGVSGERREVDLNEMIEEALNLAYHGARAQDQSFNITLERDYARSLKPIELAPQEMTRVFLNLFGNGFYAATKRARENGDRSYRPSLTVVTREDDNAVEVRVRDNGIGIPPDIRDKLFQPFFTTKPTGEGTGLGLSISYDIITQQHGGTITVESEPGSFTEFTIRLPRHLSAAAR